MRANQLLYAWNLRGFNEGTVNGHLNLWTNSCDDVTIHIKNVDQSFYIISFVLHDFTRKKNLFKFYIMLKAEEINYLKNWGTSSTGY